MNFNSWQRRSEKSAVISLPRPTCHACRAGTAQEAEGFGSPKKWAPRTPMAEGLNQP